MGVQGQGKEGDLLAGAKPGQGRVSQNLAKLWPVWDLITGGHFEGRYGGHKLIGDLIDSWARIRGG